MEWNKKSITTKNKKKNNNKNSIRHLKIWTIYCWRISHEVKQKTFIIEYLQTKHEDCFEGDAARICVLALIDIMSFIVQDSQGRQWHRIMNRVAWLAQLVRNPTSTRVAISWFLSSSSVSGSVLTAWSLEPDLESLSPPLSAPPLRALSLSLSLKK